jgi:hypothetical protein
MLAGGELKNCSALDGLLADWKLGEEKEEEEGEGKEEEEGLVKEMMALEEGGEKEGGGLEKEVGGLEPGLEKEEEEEGMVKLACC